MIWLAVVFLVVGAVGGFMVGHTLKISRYVEGEISEMAKGGAMPRDYRMERSRVRSVDDMVNGGSPERERRKKTV